MPSQQEQDKARKDNLSQWFKGNKEIWQDLSDEMRICLENSTDSLRSMGCQNRDWYAGKCAGIREILRFGDKYGKETDKD